MNYFEDGSWMEAEELTTPSGSGGNQKSVVFRNSNYNGDEDHEKMEMKGHSGKTNATQRTSNF